MNSVRINKEKSASSVCSTAKGPFLEETDEVPPPPYIPCPNPVSVANSSTSGLLTESSTSRGRHGEVNVLQQVYQLPPSHGVPTRVWIWRFLMLLMIGVFTIGIILCFLHFVKEKGDGQFDGTPSSLGRDFFGLGDQSSTSESTPSTQSPSTTFADDLTKEQQCLKYCYGKVYMACSCVEDCECPPRVQVQDQMRSSTTTSSHHFGPLDILDELFNGPKDSRGSTKGSDSDDVCIALCGPVFLPTPVNCEDLLYSCDDDEDKDIVVK